jgi:hypothetical protein
MKPAWISGSYLAFDAAYVLLSIPSGMLADRLRHRLLSLGSVCSQAAARNVLVDPPKVCSRLIQGFPCASRVRSLLKPIST